MLRVVLPCTYFLSKRAKQEGRCSFPRRKGEGHLGSFPLHPLISQVFCHHFFKKNRCYSANPRSQKCLELEIQLKISLEKARYKAKRSFYVLCYSPTRSSHQEQLLQQLLMVTSIQRLRVQKLCLVNGETINLLEALKGLIGGLDIACWLLCHFLPVLVADHSS